MKKSWKKFRAQFFFKLEQDTRPRRLTMSASKFYLWAWNYYSQTPDRSALLFLINPGRREQSWRSASKNDPKCCLPSSSLLVLKCHLETLKCLWLLKFGQIHDERTKTQGSCVYFLLLAGAPCEALDVHYQEWLIQNAIYSLKGRAARLGLQILDLCSETERSMTNRIVQLLFWQISQRA